MSAINVHILPCAVAQVQSWPCILLEPFPALADEFHLLVAGPTWFRAANQHQEVAVAGREDHLHWLDPILRRRGGDAPPRLAVEGDGLLIDFPFEGGGDGLSAFVQ